LIKNKQNDIKLKKRHLSKLSLKLPLYIFVLFSCAKMDDDDELSYVNHAFSRRPRNSNWGNEPARQEDTQTTNSVQRPPAERAWTQL